MRPGAVIGGRGSRSRAPWSLSTAGPPQSRGLGLRPPRRMMSDFEVFRPSKERYEFIVRFPGPPESELPQRFHDLAAAARGHRHPQVRVRCQKAGV